MEIFYNLGPGLALFVKSLRTSNKDEVPYLHVCLFTETQVRHSIFTKVLCISSSVF